MHQSSKSQKISNQSLEDKFQSGAQVQDQADCQNAGEEFLKACEQSKNRILLNTKFKWDEMFRSNIDARVIDTNFESMKILLHYGNYRLEVSVIYTEIEEQFFRGMKNARGAFGVVNFTEFGGRRCAVKGVPFVSGEDGINAENAYKEYFLSCLADALEVGPRVFQLFGYDLLITKKMVFFSMQECRPIKPEQISLAESQLQRNLRILHSLKLVHRDIKPANIAFSGSFKKNVFIDYGLSEFIRQAPGQKTSTQFRGTLLYCSQEMRKCYFLPEKIFVDLYGNDQYGLLKTIQAFHSFYQGYSLLDNIAEDFQEKYDQSTIFNRTIFVLRLKYYIENQNIPEILNLLQKNNNDIIRTIYQTLSNPQIPASVQKNRNIQEIKESIKTQIFAPELKIHQTDALLFDFFSLDKRTMSAQKIIPFQLILKSQPEFSNKYLKNPQFVLKLFYFFQPFSKNSHNSGEDRLQLKRIIVKSICNLKQPAFKEPMLFSEKIRHTLIYFYENLRSLRNLKVLVCLRLLFLSIQQFQYVPILEKEIVQIIDEPFLKMLKLSEFILLKDNLFEELEQEKQQMWGQVLRKLEINQQISKQSKLKYFLEIIVDRSNYRKASPQFTLFLVNLLKQISQQCCSIEEKQAIYLVKHAFLQLFRLSYNPFPEEAPKGLALKIYSSYFIMLKFKLSGHQEKQSKFFKAYDFQFSNQTRLDQKNLIKGTIENFIQVLDQRGEPMGKIVQKILRFDFVEKSYITYFLEKIREEFIKLQRNPVSLTKTFKILYSINVYIEFIKKCQRKSVGNQKLQKQEKAYFMKELRKLFSKFLDNEETKLMVNSTKCMKLHAGIINLKLNLENGKAVDGMQKQVQVLVDLLQTLTQEGNIPVVYFFTFMDCLYPYLQKDEDHYSKRILVQLGQFFMAKKHLYIFQVIKQLLGLFIRIKNQQGKEEENLAMILSIMDYVGPTKQPASAAKIETQFFQMGMRTFCHTVAPQKLAEIYSRLRFKEQEFACGFYAYFLFEIFLKAKDSASQAQQLRQTTRTTLCLGSMSWNCQMKVKSDIFKFYRTLVNFKSKRRALVFRRSEIRSTADSGRVKMFVREFENRVENASRKNVERALGKLSEKIRNLAKL